MSQAEWFREGVDGATLKRAGFRVSGGGAHQSKTMMLRELTTLLAAQVPDLVTLRALVLDENILGKSTAAARAGSLRHLRNLYGLGAHAAVTDALAYLWVLDAESRPLLALSCALARDPLLRDSATAVWGAAVGTSLGVHEITETLGQQHPARFSPAMLKSLAQNCASSWTQSGLLSGRVKKVRAHPRATPVAAAYAALLASLAGFGGPALIASPWMDALDVSPHERLSLLRRAESLGLLRVRAAGDVIEVVLDPLLARIEPGAAPAHV